MKHQRLGSNCFQWLLIVALALHLAACSKMAVWGEARAPITIATTQDPQTLTLMPMSPQSFSVATHGSNTASLDQQLHITDSSFIESRSAFRIEIEAPGGFDSDSLSLGSAQIRRMGVDDSFVASMRLANGRLVIESSELYAASNSKICVLVSGVRSSTGAPYASVRIALNRLLGDGNGSGVLDPDDWKALHTYFGIDLSTTLAEPSVIRSDYDLDGEVTIADELLANNASGTLLGDGDPSLVCD